MAKGFVGLQVTNDPPHAVVAVLDLVDQHGILQVSAWLFHASACGAMGRGAEAVVERPAEQVTLPTGVCHNVKRAMQQPQHPADGGCADLRALRLCGLLRRAVCRGRPDT